MAERIYTKRELECFAMDKWRGSGLSKQQITLPLASCHPRHPCSSTDSEILHHSCHGISNSYFIINRKIANLNVIISARVELFLARSLRISPMLLVKSAFLLSTEI